MHEAMATNRLETLPQAWEMELARLLSVDDPELIPRAAVTVHPHSPSSLAAELLRVADKPRLPMETRLRALASSVPGRQIDDKVMQNHAKLSIFFALSPARVARDLY